MPPATDVPFFDEVQRFGGWLRAAVAAPAFLIVPLFSWGLYQQLVLGKPFGNQPMSNARLATASIISIVITVAIALLFTIGRLETRVFADRVVIRFRPFHLRGRVIALADIAEVEGRTYHPVIEYGGWGIRRNAAGMAYTVSGNEGVYLTLREGGGVLIGSRRSGELAAAIRARL